MKPSHHQLHFLISSVFLSLKVIVLLPVTHALPNRDYETCKSPFNCGLLPNLSYPFWGTNRSELCGHEDFMLTCESNQKPVISIGLEKFVVLNVKQNVSSMTISRFDFWNNACPLNLTTTRLNNTKFKYGADARNLSLLYDCASPILALDGNRFSCPGRVGVAFYATDAFISENGVDVTGCRYRIDVPILEKNVALVDSGDVDLEEILKGGFSVIYEFEGSSAICPECEGSGGACGMNRSTSNFTCICPDGSYPSVCLHNATGSRKEKEMKRSIIVGVVTAFVSITMMALLFIVYARRKNKHIRSSSVAGNTKPDSSSKAADVEEGDNFLGVHVFSYDELEKATDNFDSAKEVGDGGYGVVYHGKLRDGREVAVKRLYENNCKRMEQFMNEVDILTHLRHQHLVSLYGCTSRHSRELILVYEYIPNGTVADHLHGENAKASSLPWSVRLNVAVETAGALAYLHACDIVHRDVKTSNILLDKNFSVKVADFGLSRLFPTNVSHVSTTPQGTPGYVDPEYYKCYQLTAKSDVYSFGVVLFELISSMPAVDITRQRHEINLSNMAIEKIQTQALHELVDESLGFASNHAVRKMVSVVAELAFQCLQSEKESRPSMEQIVEVLQDVRSRDYGEDADDSSSDVVGLLKHHGLPVSPDSVTFKWMSYSTAPDSSSTDFSYEKYETKQEGLNPVCEPGVV